MFQENSTQDTFPSGSVDREESLSDEKLRFELEGDGHILTSIDTPMHSEAHQLSPDQKIEIIQEKFAEIMHVLGLDLEDDSLRGTPYRVAKMYVNEIFSGLLPENKPKVSVFENTYGYKRMLIEKNIELSSNCEHHFLPIVGKAHVAYISSGKVIGLSKINRLVDYYSRRPQVQERLTIQICRALQEELNTEDVIVVIDGAHMCVSQRGIKDQSSTTLTMEYGGAFNKGEKRREFLDLL